MIKFKRARNSLLNISKLPPEILGNIFCWSVTPEGNFGDFDGLKEDSHDFLLVCHHWFEVAMRTPELWCSWGNTLEDWERWHRRSGAAPLDLILDDEGDLDDILCNTLQDRAAADRIRRVHLKSRDSELLNSIIASLIVECEEIRSNSVESLVLCTHSEGVDLSDFFAHYRFPKLRRLDLSDCTISSWDHLTSRTGALTNLELNLFIDPNPSPTTSQLLSILVSNPTLQRLALHGCAIPNDNGGKSSFRVPLHYLKELELSGYSPDVIKFLHRLDHPADMDRLTLDLIDCLIAEISQTVGPYFRDYVRGRGRSQTGLELFSFRRDAKLYVGDVHETGRRMDPFMWIGLTLGETLPDLVAHAPPEEIVYFEMHNDLMAMGDVYMQFPNLRTISLTRLPLSSVFPMPNLGGGGGVFLSLRYVFLRDLIVDSGDWSPLTTFLARRMSSGNRLDVLEISTSPHMCPEVVEIISGAVQELKVKYPDPVCRFGICS